MKKKKVMFFIYQMGSGGAARTFLNILNHLDRRDFEPILVTLDFNGDYEALLASDIKFIKLETKRLRSAIIPLAKLLRKERPHIILSTVPVYNTIAVLAKLLSFTNTKSIVREAALLGGTFKQDLSLRMFGLIYRMASKVISLSEGVKSNLIQRYKIKEKNIKVIYNPVDIEKIEHLAHNGQILEEHQLIFNRDSKIIVTAGRFVKEKDHKTLIEAVNIVRQKIDVELLILGEGELEHELKQQVKQLNIEHKVHFIGFQNNPYVYFKNADLFVLSSINEGFGHVLVEALTVGTPVVSTDCYPGAREVLENGKYGMISKVSDPEDLANNIYHRLTMEKSERSKVILNGIKRANDFNAKLIVKQYEEVFQEVVDKEKRYRKRS